MADLKLALIQADLFWENKAANLEAFQQKIASLPAETEIVVLPEMFSTGFSMSPQTLAEKKDGETVRWMKLMSREYSIVLIGSIIIEENEKFYNRLFCMLPTGDCGMYDKRHLFSFAGEDKHYTPGNKRLIASVKGWKINMQVCYDLRFPVWARQQVVVSEETLQPEYDVLIYVANWPQVRIQAWRTLLLARAIENQCYVVGVNRVGEDGNGTYHNGCSMVINPLGDVLYHSEDVEDAACITLHKDSLETIRNRFPFLNDADDFKII